MIICVRVDELITEKTKVFQLYNNFDSNICRSAIQNSNGGAED